MGETSTMFREQARADLRIAQLIPQHDLSGQALGLSMFHAQQCIEKQLKAIMLRLNEEMELEADDGFLQELSHKFYLKLHTVRRRFVQRLCVPPSPVLRIMGLEQGERAFERNENTIGRLGAFWEKYTDPDSRFHASMWKHSMHVELSACEQHDMKDFLNVDAADLSDALGQPVPTDHSKVRLGDYSSPPPMRQVIMDRQGIERAYADHRRNRYRLVLQTYHDWHMALQDRMFSDATIRRLRSFRADEQGQALRRLVAEYAFEAASSQAYRYAPLFPHNTMGRYPMRLPGGKTTTEIYESQADVALHWIYNETRFNFEMLCDHASKLDELCGLGREHGYW